jgi:hypothetical protein
MSTARPADGHVKLAPGEEERIARLLEVEPLAVLPPQQPILGIDRVRFGNVIARLLIHGRGHDQLVQLLDRPAVVHEAHGEVIEQLRMRRRLAARAEVAGRAHEALAEVMQPDAVDHHARGERVVLARDGASEV